MRRALVVAQVALSLVLVAGALLFSRSLGKLLTVETGFRQEGVLVANVAFQRLNLSPDHYSAFKDELLERIRAIPGVEAAAVTHEIPLKGFGGATVWLDGADAQQGNKTRLSRVAAQARVSSYRINQPLGISASR